MGDGHASTTDTNLLAKLGDVLRKSSHTEIHHFNESKNSLFHKVADMMQKSSQNLPKVDHFNDFDDDSNGDDNLLQKFVDVLRKPSQRLKEKRKRRRKLYRV